MSTVLESLLAAHPELNIPVHSYNINVTSNSGDKVSASDAFSQMSSFGSTLSPSHVYFHLPLCNYICHYCNYVKRKVNEKSRPDEIAMWADLLIAEMNIYIARQGWIREVPISSMYIGGGTGALLLQHPDSLARLVAHLDHSFAVQLQCERTMEGNPENFTPATLKVALDLGFNRFSVGVQSLQDKVNEFTNRGHDAREALRAIELLTETGKPFSVDMMFGLPFQTPDSVESDIKILTDLKVPTISLYRLRNSEREKMGIGNASVWNVEANKVRLDNQGLLPNVVETYRMRDRITTVLRSAGYHPSPCGWWNRPDVYGAANIPTVSRDKWQNYSNMIAFGPGAYGWYTGRTTDALQTHNITDISAYIEHMRSMRDVPPLSHGRLLTGLDAIGTRLAFAFKANQPINVDEYESRFGVRLLRQEPYATVFNTLLEKGLMREIEGRNELIPTEAGEELHEEIMYQYFHKGIGGGDLSFCRRTAAAV